jgi:hypothetical protein
MTKKQLQVIVKKYDYLLPEKPVYERASRSYLEKKLRQEKQKFKFENYRGVK